MRVRFHQPPGAGEGFDCPNREELNWIASDCGVRVKVRTLPGEIKRRLGLGGGYWWYGTVEHEGRVLAREAKPVRNMDVARCHIFSQAVKHARDDAAMACVFERMRRLGRIREKSW